LPKPGKKPYRSVLSEAPRFSRAGPATNWPKTPSSPGATAPVVSRRASSREKLTLGESRVEAKSGIW
jgi:hypothetical protein